MNALMLVLRSPLFWVRASALCTLAGALITADTWDQAGKALAVFGAVWGLGKLDTQPRVMNTEGQPK